MPGKLDGIFASQLQIKWQTVFFEVYIEMHVILPCLELHLYFYIIYSCFTDVFCSEAKIYPCVWKQIVYVC